jgi:uncharacterized protein
LTIAVSAVWAQTEEEVESFAELAAAALSGEAESQYLLGSSYLRGEGVPDYATAAMWHAEAAEQGHADAQFNLGLMYANGDGVPEDDAIAVEWFTKAAEQGYADAQYRLGIRYEYGEGVPEDDVIAYMWFNLAAAKGSESAKSGKDKIAKEMTAADISKAQVLSRECLAQNYQNCGY